MRARGLPEATCSEDDRFCVTKTGGQGKCLPRSVRKLEGSCPLSFSPVPSEGEDRRGEGEAEGGGAAPLTPPFPHVCSPPLLVLPTACYQLYRAAPTGLFAWFRLCTGRFARGILTTRRLRPQSPGETINRPNEQLTALSGRGAVLAADWLRLAAQWKRAISSP